MLQECARSWDIIHSCMSHGTQGMNEENFETRMRFRVLLLNYLANHTMYLYLTPFWLATLLPFQLVTLPSFQLITLQATLLLFQLAIFLFCPAIIPVG